MNPTFRRTATLIAAILTSALAACTNPIAPASGSDSQSPPTRPNNAAYQGSVG